MMTMTDDQVRILGREIGKAFADEFWEQVRLADPYRSVRMSATYLLQTVGEAIGKIVAEHLNEQS